MTGHARSSEIEQEDSGYYQQNSQQVGWPREPFV